MVNADVPWFSVCHFDSELFPTENFEKNTR